MGNADLGPEADLAAAFARAKGLVHLTNAGTTSRHGFAVAILQGPRSRGASLKATEVVLVATADYPTKAKRPANSRLECIRDPLVTKRVVRACQSSGCGTAPVTRIEDLSVYSICFVTHRVHRRRG
ncbi:sugar nucleotide-binding protein [Bradyrhizobium sp.]|uniref:sugar nucleotide-binding protein n=1 Tax=Bradyrhizobium sp. TaxID=376 RepID=UPI002DDCCFF0|nr:sugar nucleotide-binding protein [Bradyrhizobium sp.]HEV2154832.1 sugar nucleotide-binding protein [Bradyrhizobium sp.]